MKIEKRVAAFLGIALGFLLPVTPELGLVILAAFTDPLSIFNWSPWFYPLGLVSVAGMLSLAIMSPKFNEATAFFIWAGQAVFCGGWIVGKVFVLGQSWLFSAWYLLCSAASIYVAFKIQYGRRESREATT
ncbi:hypothetical protein [Marinobacterium mangrovicola]|uniref:hypothetical protein n=1 Tax=Marinobacterium mangrovicola TaxID=1476959 RepID=UPI00104AA3BB|nr:hypothetical protein [Marinobacterium mangrovicola]